MRETPHILVVDDRAPNRELLEAILEEEGFFPILARSGREALRLAADDLPDTILLDVAMPGMDGFDVCRHLQQNMNTAFTPVIFVTAQADDKESVCRGLALGATDYITKPFDPDELVARLRAALRLKEQNDRLRLLALTDPLTGLGNRRAISAQIKSRLSRWRRHREPFALLMADIDHFKRINDTFGHEAGDQVLTSLSDLFLDVARTEDAVGRIGGEEFVILLDHAHRETAVSVAERLRQRVARLSIRWKVGAPIAITLSIGVISSDDCAPTIREQGILRCADDALYRAKEGGRNRVVYYPDLAPDQIDHPAPCPAAAAS